MPCAAAIRCWRCRRACGSTIRLPSSVKARTLPSMSEKLETMIAIEISHPGGPEVLVPTERPRPVPSTGEVLIKVAAAGVNRPDVMQRLGKYPPPPGASDIPGLEVAGTVDAVGDGVSGVSPGDRVCALVAG